MKLCPHCRKLCCSVSQAQPGEIALCLQCGGYVTVADNGRVVQLSEYWVSAIAPRSVVRELIATQRAIVGSAARHATKH